MASEFPETPPSPQSGKPLASVDERANRQRHRLLQAFGIFVFLLGLDQLQEPRRQVSTRLLVGSIHLYQATISPHLSGLGVQCRFEPTCSHYGEGAILKYGAVVGSFRAVARIARCGPWTPLGTVDLP